MVKTPLYLRDASCDHLEPLWLQAQAVPSASLVPCVRDLPIGWSLANVAVNDGRRCSPWTTTGPAPPPWSGG